MMDGYLVAGIVLLLMAFGAGACGGSALDVAVRSANIAGTTAITAHDEIRALCVDAEKRASTPEAGDVVIATCDKAEDAYGAFRAAWLTMAAALRTAMLVNKTPDNLPALVAAVTDAAKNLADAVESIRALP